MSRKVEDASERTHRVPSCRAVFDVSKFTINLQITNNYTSVTSNILTNEDQSFRVFDVFELNLDMDEQIDLDELFADLNIDINDLNPAVFDTRQFRPVRIPLLLTQKAPQNFE